MKRVYVIGTGNACKEALRMIDSHDSFEVAGLATVPEDALASEKKYSLILIDKNKSELAEHIRNAKADILLSVVSPLVLSRDILDSVAVAINLHPGLLPHYSGFYTHLWALINGETEFGVTLHKMEDRVDTGAIYGEERFTIAADDTGIKVYMNAVKASGRLIKRFLDDLAAGSEINYKPLDLSSRRNYKRSELENYIINPEESSIVEAMRAFRAHQFKPFTSPVGDLKIKLNNAVHTVQKMKAVMGEEAIAENAVLIRFTDGMAELVTVDNQPAMLALEYGQAN